MTDYFYQARVRDDPPEDEGETPFADAGPRRNLYPPEDEAYWAEAGADPHRQRSRSGTRTASAWRAAPLPSPGPAAPSRASGAIRPRDGRSRRFRSPADDGARMPGHTFGRNRRRRKPGREPGRQDPAYGCGAHEPVGWSGGTRPSRRGSSGGPGLCRPAPRPLPRAPRPRSGERNIRFDPTKERGPVYLRPRRPPQPPGSASSGSCSRRSRCSRSSASSR